MNTQPVHPRVCGERPCCVVTWALAVGSSPRVRGTLCDVSTASRERRFIPACAGNASFVVPDNLVPAVHPRVCGERNVPSLSDFLIFGSSPRVRGTRRWPRFTRRRRRFIPACAGNASASAAYTFGYSVHPRVCGERNDAQRLGFRRNGSSPRVRGTQHGRCCYRGGQRFIPACAGNAR